MIIHESMGIKGRIGKFAVILVSVLFAGQVVMGQRTVSEKPDFKSRIFYGGSFALQLGTFTDVEILPVAGIWILPRVAVAAGPGFRFYSYSKQDHTNVYSIRGFTQLVVLRDIDRFIPLGTHTSIILQLEDEGLSLESKFWHNVDIKPRRFMVNSVLGGGGFSQPIGKKGALDLFLLWELNSTGYNLYDSPIFRIGIFF